MSNLPVIGDIIDAIPGVKEVEEVLDQLHKLAGRVGSMWDALQGHDPTNTISRLANEAHHASNIIGGAIKPNYDWLNQNVTSQIWRTLLSDGLGLDADAIDREAKGSLDTLDTLMGFTIALPLVFSGLSAVAKFFLGQRFPEGISETMGKIPEEMGISWAMGMLMDRTLEAALGNKLEEAILYQKRPNFPDWRILRTMVTQKLIDEKTLKDRAAHMGFNDTWVNHIAAMADAALPVGDIQNLYLHGLMDGSEVDDKLKALGFSGDDQAKLRTLYIDKAETQAGVQLRAVARELFRSQLITAAQYRGYLTSTNMPMREVEDDIQALELEATHGRTRSSTATIKALYQRGQMTPDDARKNLRFLGQTESAIEDLLRLWDLPHVTHPMSQAKVLSYWYSGVITDRSTAFNALLLLNLRPQDADFLLDHPPAGNARLHKLTPGLIVQAYMDGVINDDGLADALKSTGLDGNALAYRVQTAQYRKSRTKHVPGPSVPLSRSDVLKAFKLGVMDPETAGEELRGMGYSTDDALILLELENKGSDPFARGPAPTFANVDDAVAFLEGLGFVMHPPPDPRIGMAESMAGGAGWTWDPPGTAALPGTWHGPGGFPGLFPSQPPPQLEGPGPFQPPAGGPNQ